MNTDNGPTRAWSTVPYTVLAVDARDLHEPTEVTGRAVLLTAGGRVDLDLVAPEDGSGFRVQVGSATAVMGGPEKVAVPEPPPPERRSGSTPPTRTGPSATRSAGVRAS